MCKLHLLNKTNALKLLSRKITTARVLPIYTVKYKLFIENSEQELNNIVDFFADELLIIRSSASNEDTLQCSNAGKYKTVLNVNKNNKKELFHAIIDVFNSYENITGIENEEVLIQPMLKNIKFAGVAFTCDIDTLAPYYVINYGQTSDGSFITGGMSNSAKTYVSFRFNNFRYKDETVTAVINTCKEIEELFDYKYLDIEFAFNEQCDLYIFQVRPIATLNKNDLSILELNAPLGKIYKKITKLSSQHPSVLGDKAIYGIMPDWNPAEIIGIRPRKLALSLYKELVTDYIWASQRNQYGYRNLLAHPLLISFLGVPHIDIRASLNSFIPEKLNEKIANKLANYYLDKLAKTPAFHDKVEFQIVNSCYYLNLPEKLKELLKFGFNENELKRIEFSLLELTNNIIHPANGLFKKDMDKILELEKRYEIVLNSNLPVIDKLYWLIEDCKKYGTIAFAGVARAAFIAVQFLKSLVSCNIMTELQYSQFLQTLNTINKQMNKDLIKLKRKVIQKEDFLKQYGHIRPGTYDILSARYDENFDQYFSLELIKEPNEHDQYIFSDKQLKDIDALLLETGVNITADELISFIVQAIEGREYTKFIFTKSLSKVLQLIEDLGQRLGIDKEDLSHLDFKCILELYSTLNHRQVKDIFIHNIENNKKAYEYTQALKLPSIIIEPEDIYHFYLQHEEPNYITLKKIQAETVLECDIDTKKLNNKIVFIKSADPGYDFIFSQDIAGLITQYGGANSHMTIRCAEYGIPAVIGAGEKNYDNWSKANILEIDAANRVVKILQ